MEILYSPHFLRSLKKIPQEIEADFNSSLEIFKRNPFDSRLKIHKLSGKLKGLWSFSITPSYRVIFRFRNKQIHLFDIGDHSIYR